MNNWLINNLSKIWTTGCELCAAVTPAGRILCQSCEKDILRRGPACRCCAVPLSGGAPSIDSESLLCGSCQKLLPQYRSVYRFAQYAAPLDKLLLRFKFQQKLSIGHQLGKLMALDIERQRLPMPDVLLPVPLHHKRLKQRGYNQALELARPIAKQFQLPLDTQHCVRTKPTHEQMNLPAKERKKNIRGAFAVSENFKDQHVAIIDDVMTTGSTVNELSKQLVKSGAKCVDVWVCARAAL